MQKQEKHTDNLQCDLSWKQNKKHLQINLNINYFPPYGQQAKFFVVWGILF